jgi:hypothetical protein
LDHSAQILLGESLPEFQGQLGCQARHDLLPILGAPRFENLDLNPTSNLPVEKHQRRVDGLRNPLSCGLDQVPLGLFVRDRQPCRHVRDATVNRSASIILPSGSSVSRARMWRLLRRDPRWRVGLLASGCQSSGCAINPRDARGPRRTPRSSDAGRRREHYSWWSKPGLADHREGAGAPAQDRVGRGADYPTWLQRTD